jgi:hypothetical protein
MNTLSIIMDTSVLRKIYCKMYSAVPQIRAFVMLLNYLKKSNWMDGERKSPDDGAVNKTKK